jgi:putative ABC transport system ATP-binding protein
VDIIDFRAVSKRYAMGQYEVRALDGIDLRIGPNEYVAVIGSSGSGKSTMMHILGCLDRPTSGAYLFKGRNVGDMSENELADVRNQDVGFVFQSFNLMNRLSALENVMQPLVYRGTSYKERRQLAEDCLAQVGLANRMSHVPTQLSGGQRQRVAIARALITQPAILLADEPTGNLDSETTDEILRLFDQLHSRGQTIIMVTHEPDVAAHCRRVVQLKDGRILRDTQG